MQQNPGTHKICKLNNLDTYNKLTIHLNKKIILNLQFIIVLHLLTFQTPNKKEVSLIFIFYLLFII